MDKIKELFTGKILVGIKTDFIFIFSLSIFFIFGQIYIMYRNDNHIPAFSILVTTTGTTTTR